MRREIQDFRALLAAAGLLLRPARPEAAWLGDEDVHFDSAGAVVGELTRIGNPLHEAGVDNAIAWFHWQARQ